MIYNTSNPQEAARLQDRVTRLVTKGVNVELTEKTKKSLQHNNYFHLLCAYFGMETGYSTKEVKDKIVKEIVCPDVFEYKKGVFTFYESFANITKEQTSYVIEKFKNYAANEAGITLPEADDYAFLQYIQAEESKFNNKVHQN